MFQVHTNNVKQCQNIIGMNIYLLKTHKLPTHIMYSVAAP